jgi:hypothetical protein
MRHLIMALDLDPKDANLVKASPYAGFWSFICINAHCFYILIHTDGITTGGHGAAGRGGGGGGAGLLIWTGLGALGWD